MDFLQTNKQQIVKEDGAPFYLRGLCVGGWMNMENFINGYPGTEISLREHDYRCASVYSASPG